MAKAKKAIPIEKPPRETAIGEELRTQLREHLAVQGLTRHKFAKLIGMDHKTIGKFLDSPTADPLLSTAERIAQALGHHLEYRRRK